MFSTRSVSRETKLHFFFAVRVLRDIHCHNSPADWCKNCGKSAKICTKIENYLLNNISYGPTWDLPHNCNYNGFKVAHYTSKMETRPGELFLYFQQSETMYWKKLTSETKKCIPKCTLRHYWPSSVIT